MFEAFSSFLSSPSSPSRSSSPKLSEHINVTPRRGKVASAAATPSTINKHDSQTSKLISDLQNQLREKDAAIANLTSRLQKFGDRRVASASASAAVASSSSKGSSKKNQVQISDTCSSIPPLEFDDIIGAQFDYDNDEDDEDATTTSNMTGGGDSSSSVSKRRHPLTPVSHIITDKGRIKADLGTRGSLLTSNILKALPDSSKTPAQQIAEKFLTVFQNPVDYLPYLRSTTFASDLSKVCTAVSAIFEEEPRCIFLQSPVYVFGDIHGNLEDLHFFSDNMWKLGMDLTAGQFLFLGDYVDRGMSCLECVAYLFGLKILYPNKIHLLRGNHETREV
jgi:Calcineurin-like phosphoesterase